MSRLRFILGEARNEFRAGLRGPLVPICFIGLAVYLLLVVLNAEYLRGMNAVNVPRNSPHVVFLMLAGQAMWMFFAWAWLFAQVVVRDRIASQHEVVLAAPVSLRTLLFARFLGAAGVGGLLSFGVVAGFLLIPLLAPLGLVAPEFVGPNPWFAFAQGTMLFTIPSMLGAGALFVWAAVRTRSTTGPFAVAAGMVLVWMVSMIVLREGQTFIGLASMLDPSGYSEVEEQTNLWTPHEKGTLALAYTVPLVVNRLAWLFGPLLFAGLALARVRREQLVLEREPQVRGGRPGFGTRLRTALDSLLDRKPAAEAVPPPARALPGPPASPSWVRATLNEAGWHLAVSCRGRGLLIAVFMLVMACVAGGYVNIVMDAEGPLLPRSGLLQPMLAEFTYIVLVFMVAGFVGAMTRRDERPGFGEMVDATPAPLGSRFTGRLLAVSGITLGFAVIPAIGAWALVAAIVPEGLNLADPILFYLGVMGPAYLELCAITLLLHALLGHTGTAHAAAVIAGVHGRRESRGRRRALPAGPGRPSHRGRVLGVRRLVALGGPDVHRGSVQAGLRRAGGGGRLVRLAPRYRPEIRCPPPVGARAAPGWAPARWRLPPRSPWRRAAQCSTSGSSKGDTSPRPPPTPRTPPGNAASGTRRRRFRCVAERSGSQWIRGATLATVNWRLDGVRSAGGTLHGTLPDGAAITSVAVRGVPAPVTTGFDHFGVPLGTLPGHRLRAGDRDDDPSRRDGLRTGRRSGCNQAGRCCAPLTCCRPSATIRTGCCARPRTGWRAASPAPRGRCRPPRWRAPLQSPRRETGAGPWSFPPKASGPKPPGRPRVRSTSPPAGGAFRRWKRGRGRLSPFMVRSEPVTHRRCSRTSPRCVPAWPESSAPRPRSEPSCRRRANRGKRRFTGNCCGSPRTTDGTSPPADTDTGGAALQSPRRWLPGC